MFWRENYARCCCGIFCRRADFVVGHLLSPAMIYVDVHGTYCRQSTEQKTKLGDEDGDDYDDDDDDDADDSDNVMIFIIIFIETC